MIDSDKQKFGELLRATLSVFGQEVSSGVVAIWWEALRRFEYAEVRSALSRHIQNVDSGQFSPKPVDVIRVLEGGSTEGRALSAWTKVLEALRKVGTYRSVVFDDPLIHAVLEDMGGWIQLGKLTNDETPFRAQEFQKRYRAMVHNPPSSYPPSLLGVAEATNMTNGFRSDPPMLIGNPDVCNAVISGGSSTPKIPMRQADEVVTTTVAAISAQKSDQDAP